MKWSRYHFLHHRYLLEISFTHTHTHKHLNYRLQIKINAQIIQICPFDYNKKEKNQAFTGSFLTNKISNVHLMNDGSNIHVGLSDSGHEVSYYF